MATYVIGDVQGCHTELRRLVDQLKFDPVTDELWFVGDLVNRGPHSLDVLRFVKSLGSRAIVVLGNHDLHLISLGFGSGRIRADDTLGEVLNACDRDELIDWLRTCNMLHATGRHIVVHAGLLPHWHDEMAMRLANEVERVLRGADCQTFLANMYGSLPDAWQDDLAGFDRLRVIVNAMTRMRFCTPDGRMEFHHKGAVDSAPPGFEPWFVARTRSPALRTVVFGHWSSLGLYQSEHAIGIDTGCVWGSALTAVRLEDRRMFQEPAATQRIQAPRR
ncbi:MAG: symmetrical bis(5'-nucleosyl)-tetraphosphatase [Betaproteobacteria bacterium]|nr:symmetrical bis(5'-nucleosyl)-tetraphosphatase [Betaproteobacteria bacterium]